MFAKKLTVLLTVMVVSLGVLFAASLQTAEAKRIGGGANFGSQKQSFSRQATTPTNPASAPTRSAAPAAGGASRWLGPLAGLAAGGLLAAMFFGGAFDGLKPMDFIIIALFALGAFMLIRALRKSSQSAASPYARSTAGAMPGQAPQPSSIGSFSNADSAQASLPNAPVWFNEDSFLQGAKSHFTNLQRAWDANDLKTMQEYFTPELFLELARERARIGDENNVTDVQSLNAQLLDLSREGDSVVASVLFQGMVRENYGQPEPIAEIWHVRHAADSAQGDWLIVGIQQYNQSIH
ncbi:MAG: TIM44-like domain-containing protein [Halothiobacillus sp.]|nr:TIM44-like domain-containing protein [Halothiobacillus sp.]